MGKRSTNTTKSGKFMNPTDQARKEARKKELKKNKKQRMVVRQAVIKGKDPHQIMADLERLDQMEYNVLQPPSLNEKVLKEKRRKLKETWDRVLRLYFKEDKDKYLELKRIETDYEAKRSEMQKYYDAVMSTQSVNLDEIPMPSMPADEPAESMPQPILKKPVMTAKHTKTNKKPPGPPPGPPPDLSEFDEPADDERKPKAVSFGDSKAKVDINDFLKEIEDVNPVPKAAPAQPPAGIPVPLLQQPPPPILLRPPPPGFPTAAQLRPPMPPFLPRPPVGRGVAIPPPPSLLQQNHPGRPGMPPGLLPRFHPPNPNVAPRFNLPGPSPTKKQTAGGKEAHVVSERATIEAKPQLRNLSADATRFMPSSLRVRRAENQPKRPAEAISSQRKESEQHQRQKPSTDDAYQSFIKEMEEFL